MVNLYFSIFLLALLVSILTVTILVQHGKVREQVMIRARMLFEREDLLSRIDEELEGMPIPMMRDLCSLCDEDFMKEVKAWLKKRN